MEARKGLGALGMFHCHDDIALGDIGEAFEFVVAQEVDDQTDKSISQTSFINPPVSSQLQSYKNKTTKKIGNSIIH